MVVKTGLYISRPGHLGVFERECLHGEAKMHRFRTSQHMAVATFDTSKAEMYIFYINFL